MKTRLSLLLITLALLGGLTVGSLVQPPYSYDLAVTGRAAPIHPIRRYEALLTQTGTANPTAIVLENTLGTSVVWVREQAGLYTTTAVGAFPANRTTLDIGSVYPADDYQIALGGFFQLDAGSRLGITVNSMGNEMPFLSSDGGLNKTRVEIVVYPE